MRLLKVPRRDSCSSPRRSPAAISCATRDGVARRRRQVGAQGPLLRRPDAPVVHVGQAGHRTRLRHGARAGVRRRCGVDGTAATRRKILYYRDPKAPTYTATTAGINPETGNTLEPVYAETPDAVRLACGRRADSADRQQLAGVTYATVEPTDVGRTLRTVGQGGLRRDEAAARARRAWTAGSRRSSSTSPASWSKKGQPMLTIYSPEMLASQEELLLARRAREVMQKSPLATRRPARRRRCSRPRGVACSCGTSPTSRSNRCSPPDSRFATSRSMRRPAASCSSATPSPTSA